MKGSTRRFQATLLAGIMACANLLALSACGGGGGSGGSSAATSSIPAAPTPTPSPACTASNIVTPQEVASMTLAQPVQPNTTIQAFTRRPVNRDFSSASTLTGQYQPDLVEVVYDQTQLGNVTSDIARAEQHAGVLAVQSQLGFGHVRKIVRVLRINPSDADGTMSRLRDLPTVESVSRVSYVHLLTATANTPNDPFFTGTNGAGTNGTTTPPFYESPTKPGQWDMHIICASHAWGYAQASDNSLGASDTGVLAGSEEIAIIDTGVDTTQSDLSGKIVYSNTFVTSGYAATCPGSLTMCDKNGHGTDVAGIAAADTNNDYGVAGTAYNAKLIAERVFPNPPAGGCTAGSTSGQCEASGTDIASAITDAVAHGAAVINMSLGGGSCSGSTDPDAAEGTAVADAIAAGVVVVAAAGNAGGTSPEAPACDSGVIAVGASAIADGQTNATGKSGGTPTDAIEYVASYSNYGTGDWGIVAPGADPTGTSDTDYLHWILNLYSSQTGASGYCGTDYFGGANDCLVLIAGTSMASPHVAGVAAMIRGLEPSLTPSQIFTNLCNGADSINDSKQGCGRLNAYRAVARALGDSSVP